MTKFYATISLKGILFLLIVLSISVKGVAQSEESTNLKNNELKSNPFSLIAFEALDLGYERILNEESSLGIDLYLGLGEDNDLDYYRTFSLTPYYRKYFSRKYAKGFFIEGFAMLNSAEEATSFSFDITGELLGANVESHTDFALGISVGGKFVTPRGFVAEIYVGIGRNLIGNNNNFSPEVIGRGGISLGYRF